MNVIEVPPVNLTYPIDFTELWVDYGCLDVNEAKKRLFKFVEANEYFITSITDPRSGETEAEIRLTTLGAEQFRKGKTFYKSKAECEADVQIALARLTGGEREVRVETGIIDVLTPTQVIEVKHVSEWKHAVGQVLIYSLSFPTLDKRIHLYGHCTKDTKMKITYYAKQLGILATFDYSSKS